jgi:erythronate-4-phosphate dehydrogenase
LDDVLGQDAVTLHVPLTRENNHPTFHLLNARTLGLLKTNATLVNTSRGEIIDNDALLNHLLHHPGLNAVLDVWEGEPAINQALAHRAAIATAHIAGYSLNGKRDGTQIVYQDFCSHFGIQDRKDSNVKPRKPLVLENAKTTSGMLNKAVLQAYPISSDFLAIELDGLAEKFDQRRNNYQFRTEFSDYSFSPGEIPEGIASELAALGFAADH